MGREGKRGDTKAAPGKASAQRWEESAVGEAGGVRGVRDSQDLYDHVFDFGRANEGRAGGWLSLVQRGVWA